MSKISVTASFGLAQIVEQDFIRAIGAADQLLYSAKQSGRNCIGLDCTQMISTALN